MSPSCSERVHTPLFVAATLLRAGSVPLSLPPCKLPVTRLQPNLRHRTFDDVLLKPSTTRARKRSQALAARVGGLNRCQLHWRATSRALWTLALCIEHALILPFGFRQATLYRAPLRWRLQLSAKPSVRSEGLHRVD
jgi:hypothetical protein